ncbi:hypothetical protein AQUCO_02200216v1 [Aquilegia coerulea]|uniref:Fe2OG dioxygenase domain-containing protein n=1 Tax=Aquilegia coerulea TaxID=218851 RepID=A0A2G5DDM9_AQUCA|nr:hypothetical protein AQUCO_02200216v1 [Aquilegia coerulea]
MAPSVSDDSRNVTDFVVKKGNGIKGLAETGLQNVPKQYIQPLEERMDMQNIVTHEFIPIIDMSKGDDLKVGKAICDAAEKWGFFQVINHGVPIEVLENVKEATNRFFGLPAEEKMKYTPKNSGTLNVRYGTSFVPKAESSLEWKDYLSLFYTSEEEASAFWPKECNEQALEYMKASEVTIGRILDALMKGLNVTDIDAKKSSMLMGSKRINFNYYPKCPNPELTVGVGRHSDISTITVLLQDDIGGLYVRGIDGKGWIHVPPVTDSLVINVGDALQIMSNGRYKSIEHRVVANGSKNRISVPIFVNPKPKDMIGPLPEVLEKGEKPIYRTVLYNEYAKHFFNKAHDGKKTIDFALI